jgi:hypothetical protein
MSKLGVCQARSGEVLRGKASQVIKFVGCYGDPPTIDDHFQESKGFSFDGRFRIDQIEIDSVMSKGLETTDRLAVGDQTDVVDQGTKFTVGYPTMQRTRQRRQRHLQGNPVNLTATPTPNRRK